jgi:hypothetical protein
MQDNTLQADRRDEILRWMRRRRLTALILSTLSMVVWGGDWLAWHRHERVESLVLLGVGLTVSVVAIVLLLMYAVLAVEEARLEPDSSPRKHGVLALTSILIGCGGSALDIHDYLHNRAWVPLGCPVHCTFARAQFPVGFWASHILILLGFLYFVRVGLTSAGKWWRTARRDL